MIDYSYFQNRILLASLHWFKFIVEVRVFYFSTKTYRRRKLNLLQKAIFHSLHQSAIHSRKYRIYSIYRPGPFLNFWTLRVSASVVRLVCNKTINVGWVWSSGWTQSWIGLVVDSDYIDHIDAWAYKMPSCWS